MAERAFFPVFHDKCELLEDLTDEQCGKLLRMLANYSIYGKIPELPSGVLRMAFRSFKSAIDSSNEKYQQLCDTRRECGKKGGRPPKQKKQTVSNKNKDNQMVSGETLKTYDMTGQDDDNTIHDYDNEKDIPIHEEEEEEESERREKPPDKFNGLLLNFQRRNNKSMSDSLLQACMDSAKSIPELNTIIEECSEFPNVEDLILRRLVSQPF